MDRFNVSLYPREAERLVRNVGTACPGVFRIPLKVKGIDCATGCETTASINAQELSEAMAPIKDKILEVIKNVLHDLPPQDRM
jgi:actin-like ATPase involved in cell morphogenesis